MTTNTHSSSFTVDLADTPEARARGLMDRTSLRGVDGMLFVFASPTVAPFWNQRTLLPLDILFADAEGRIVDRLAMRSILETGGRVEHYAPHAPYIAALELLRGRAPMGVARMNLLPHAASRVVPTAKERGAQRRADEVGEATRQSRSPTYGSGFARSLPYVLPENRRIVVLT